MYTGVKIQGYDDSDEIREGSALKYAPLPRPCAFQHHTLLSHLLTYIFNFPVDTLNKNFMKMVGDCATKERVLLNQLHIFPLPPSSLFSLVSCFSAQPGNEIFNGQIVARNSITLETREINS